MNVKTRALKVISASLLSVSLLGACSASTDDASPPGDDATSATTDSAAGADTDADGTVIRPGSPGEEAETGAPVEPLEPAPWNHSDIAFVQMMVPHHAQALQMSRLAPSRAASPDVRRLAQRIDAAQGPEIVLMASWLEQQGVAVPTAAEDPMSYDHSDHGHDAMEGMLTPGQMKQLEAARGARFDRLFLAGMIDHHRGALAMAETVGAGGSAVQVAELAADVSSGQSAEISRMQGLLRS